MMASHEFDLGMDDDDEDEDDQEDKWRKERDLWIKITIKSNDSHLNFVK